MRILRSSVQNGAKRFLKFAEKEARRSGCKNAHNGAVVVKRGWVIGCGFNSPPLNREEFRTCSEEYPIPKKKAKFDRTCCVHAEWRAVMNALENHPRLIKGSTLYHARLDEKCKLAKMDKPFCTTCSRIMLDSGVKEFVTRHKKGIASYPMGEFNKLSYKFFKS